MQIDSQKWLKNCSFCILKGSKNFFFQSMSNQGTISLLELNGVRNRTRILKLIKKINTFFSMPGSYQTGKFQSFHFSNNDKMIYRAMKWIMISVSLKCAKIVSHLLLFCENKISNIFKEKLCFSPESWIIFFDTNKDSFTL